jgi:hypothetical protein
VEPARLQGNALQPPTPAAPPFASPSAATSKESHDKEQQDRPERSIDDGTDQSRTEMDAELRQQPTSDKGAQNADNEITNDPKAGASHDLSRQPACDQTDKQYNE